MFIPRNDYVGNPRDDRLVGIIAVLQCGELKEYMGKRCIARLCPWKLHHYDAIYLFVDTFDGPEE
jgi:hypothetical protein